MESKEVLIVPGTSSNGGDESENPNIPRRKILMAGEQAVGKTSLLNAFLKTNIPLYPASTLAEVGRYESEVEGEHGEIVKITIWDIPVIDQYTEIREDAYAGTHIVLLCFAIDDPLSFEGIRAHWNDEVLNNVVDIPVVLVGMKKDLRDDPATLQRLEKMGMRPVSYEDGLTMKDALQFEYYIECSSVTGEAVEAVFKAAVRAKKENLITYNMPSP